MRERILTDDSVVTVCTTIDVQRRHVEWDDIYDATEVVPDEEYRVPWEDCDGFEHTLENAADCDDDTSGLVTERGRRYRVKLVEDVDTFAYFRARGCSKQRAQELAAESRKAMVEQIAKWRNDGWQYYGVQCDFQGYGDSIWGIDDEDYAETVREEIAWQVAHQMEQDGFIMDGKPEPERRIANSNLTREQWRRRYRHNVNLFNMDQHR